MGPASVPPIARRGPSPRRKPSADATESRRQDIPLAQIDAQALTAVRRLRRFGFKAYLVGGCVRDLLLGLTPKDFDIATDARPEEVKSLFRNSRIIGRRFRLVHLYFRDGKILEVSTFRANLTPDEEDIDEDHDLLIRRDNVFGTEKEDALRRDFTINGLFYDAHAGKIIDHVGGLNDIRSRYLKMIGDPEIRLREDPVRILRAIRFVAKVGLRLDPDLGTGIRRFRQELEKCAPARLLEETLRLLRIGHAHKTVELMEETGVLSILLPKISSYLDGADLSSDDVNDDRLRERRQLLFAHLQHLDEMVHQGTVSDALVIAALLYAPLENHLLEVEGSERMRQIAAYLDEFGNKIALTRKLTEQVRQIYLLQRYLHPADNSRGRRRRRRPSIQNIIQRPPFADALNLYEVHLRATEQPLAPCISWYDKIEEVMGSRPESPLSSETFMSNRRAGVSYGKTTTNGQGAPRKRRRRRPRRR